MAALFFSRVLVELWATYSHTAVPLILPLGLALPLFFLTNLIVERTTRPLWPMLLLGIYLPLPHISFELALFLIVGVGLLIGWLGSKHGRTPSKSSPLLWGIAFTLIFAGLYALTLSADIQPADSGEFQWIIPQAGVLHPPGFPLYTMLAYLFVSLFGGFKPALAITLFSLMTSSLTLLVVWQTVWQLTRSGWGCAIAVVALGGAPTFWAQATTANIRSLTTLLAALALYALLRLSSEKEDGFDRWLITAVFFATLGIAHHPSLLFFGLIYVIYVLWLDRTILSSPRRLGVLFLTAVPAVLPFLYLPLRANSGAPGTRPSLATWDGFWNHALARGFAGDLFFFVEPSLLLSRLGVMWTVLRFQMPFWLLLGAFGGAVWLLWKNRPIAFLLIGTFGLHTLVTATYRAPQTVEYMMPAYLPLVLCLGCGVGWLGQLQSFNLMALIAAVGLMLVALFSTASHWQSFRSINQSVDTRQYSEALLHDAPQNSLVLADWHWFTPLRYLQDIEGVRPDVEVRFVSPGEGTYGETWARRIGEGLGDGRFVIATHFDELAYASLPPPQADGEAFLFTEQSASLPPSLPRLNVTVDRVTVLGVEVAETAVIGQPTPITLYWHTEQMGQPANLFIHLVGFDGQLYGQDDQTLNPISGINKTQFVPVLRPGSQPGAFAIFVGSGSQRDQIGQVQAVPGHFMPVTQQRRLFPLQQEDRQLVGFDWDQTLPNRIRLYLHWQVDGGYFTTVVDDPDLATLRLPPMIGGWGRARNNWQPPPPRTREHYVPLGRGIVWIGGDLLPERPLRPNDSVIVRPAFEATFPILRDTAVSVGLIGLEDDNFTWAWASFDDSVPAMGAIPTLKWIDGSTVISPHFVKISEQAERGESVILTLRLYDTFTNRPLPILDDRIATQLQWVPMGETAVD